MWLEDVLLGALESGVNRPTLVLLNVALTGCALVLIGLLYSLGGSSPELALHLAVVLGLAVALAIAINWLVIQTGTVDAATQRESLLGEKKGESTTKEGEEPSASSRSAAEGLTTEAVPPTGQSGPTQEAGNEESKQWETTDIAKDKRL